VTYLFLPFIFQGLIMGIDEHLHMKRNLGLWERIGHPLDTLTVLVPVSYCSVNAFSDSTLLPFILMAIFSCLFITKDEFIHSKECSPLENWLHALLFVLHPLIFLSTGLIWKQYPESEFLKYQPFVVGLFMTYQIVRWSIPWKKISK
jgi:hypothetical protein